MTERDWVPQATILYMSPFGHRDRGGAAMVLRRASQEQLVALIFLGFFLVSRS